MELILLYLQRILVIQNFLYFYAYWLISELHEGQNPNGSGSQKNYIVFANRENFCKFYLQELQAHQRKYYEIIPKNVPVRLYLDLEFYTHNNKVMFSTKFWSLFYLSRIQMGMEW